MDVETVLDQIMEAGVSVCLDVEGKLRIDKNASPALKELVREHKQALIDVKRAVALMNASGVRIIHLPLGHHALAYWLGTNLDQIRWAMKVLRMDSMPLVVNDEGLRWMSWSEWKLREQVRSTPHDEQGMFPGAAETAPDLPIGRKKA